jgi:WD40 repeat protein
MKYVADYGDINEIEQKTKNKNIEFRSSNLIKQVDPPFDWSSEQSSLCSKKFNNFDNLNQKENVRSIMNQFYFSKAAKEKILDHSSRKVEITNPASYYFDMQYKEFEKYGHASVPGSRGLIFDNTKITAKKQETFLDKSALYSKQHQSKSINKSHHLCPNRDQRIVECQSTLNCATKLFYEDSFCLETKEPGPFTETCYLPKKLIHCWSGHRKGVQKIIWYPKSAHLLLSAGLDGELKIWDVLKDRRCLASYLGHDLGVKDVSFSNDGKTFVSSSFDKSIKVWDTETGKVKCVIERDKLGLVLKIHPDVDKQHVLLVGCPDRIVYQYDIKTGDIVQEYDRHLDAVNTITFVNQNRWFLTTSDDKTIRVWEYGIPEQIKYIADPSMHSMPYVGKAPCGKWLLMQSMDNSIQTYSAGQRLGLHRKKKFIGHNNAGFSCQVGMSPDSRYVFSGDSRGRCYFWDWSTTKIARSIKAHKGACVGAIWHPYETSKVASCSLGDPLIKFWG